MTSLIELTAFTVLLWTLVGFFCGIAELEDPR